MKIIALIAARNEAHIIGTCMDSLKMFTDEIIVMDDSSTDSTAEIVTLKGGTLIKNSLRPTSGWSEHHIRSELLKIGRARGGTHFVCLDADEAFSSNFISNARSILNKMKPGEKIWMRWATLWRSIEQERVDGIYNNLFKDFIFMDDGKSEFKYEFLGVNRTPFFKKSIDTYIEEEKGIVLHFQYFFWERAQIKQAWYRCSELINAKKTPRRINHMYSITLDKNVKIKKIPVSYYSNLKLPTTSPIPWHLSEINQWFSTYGVEYFEPLEIWHIKDLHKKFVNQTKREPRSLTYPELLVMLNKLKRKFL